MQTRSMVKGTNLRQTAQRVAVAQQAHANGDMETASRLISTALHSRDLKLELRKEMEQVLLGYRAEAASELSTVQDEIKSIVEGSLADASVGSVRATDEIGKVTKDAERDPRADSLLDAMAEMREMSRRYKFVPGAADAIDDALEKVKTKDERVAAILYEPTAADLVSQARAMEAEGQACCAYLCYEEAAKLLPCWSAKRAEKRLTAMIADSADGALAKELDACRNIRRCQAKYDKAIELAGKKGSSALEAAKKMLRKVVEAAPASSQIRLAAEKELMALARRAG